MDIPEPYKRLSESSSEKTPRLKELAKPKPLKPLSGIKVEKRRERSWGALIALLFLGLIVTFSAWSSLTEYQFYKSWQESFTVFPKESQSWKWQLSKDTILEINATISGGNKDIHLYVVDDSTGQIVKDFGKVISPISIRFKSPKAGNYTVFWDNSFSTLTPKKVYAVASIYISKVKFGAIEGLVIGIVLIVLALFFMAHGNKPVLVLKVQEDIYEFKPSFLGIMLKIWVNGIEIQDGIRNNATFIIGPNDEHILEIERRFSWLWTWQWIFKVDGQEVGRLP